MKFLHTPILLFLLVMSISGCQKNDNFLIKEEAFAVITSGYNGSSSQLQITIDTMTLKYPIEPNGSFKRTDKYTFREGQDQVKLMITEKDSGKKIYEGEVKRGEYSLSIDLLYVGGKLVEKPDLPADKPGFRQASYLFIPALSGYTGDIDIVYFKNHEVVLNGMLVPEISEELARITAKPNTFSPFIEAPIFTGGRTEINGKIYFVNQSTQFFKSGTNIPYYEDAGFTIGQYATFPYLTSVKPERIGVTEAGSAADKRIDSYLQVRF
ncbi:hypothetical protein [Pedobacter metabolipauper]|uniref:Uncharacterized protein n=1 Tax=Pedobacter metabolipauper TaxID=425513 RepID=A0A4R6SV00_9SPHI|nr:hypothetical protein [Pedobacter metabolipauper]TDQ08269.1 hypothetical protein ATK78_2777 [Pedobacter metabolipauper]